MQYLGWAMIISVFVGVFLLTWKASGSFKIAALIWFGGIIISLVLVFGMKFAEGSL